MRSKLSQTLLFFVLALTLQPVLAKAQPAIDIPPILDATAIKDGVDGRPAVNPCDNFYEFACGAWLDKTVIPADKKGVSRQVTAASDATDVILNNILSAYARGDFSIPSTYAGKLSDLYLSCMSADQQTAKSLKFLQAEVKNIRRSIKDPKSLAREAAKLKLFGATTFFGFFSMQDLSDSTQVLGDIAQAGMSFDSKNYYFDTDAKSVEIRSKFLEHATNVFVLLGESKEHAAQMAEGVLNFETALAKNAYSLEDSYDPQKTNHPLDRAGLRKLAPAIDFEAYFKALGVSSLNKFNVDEPEYLAGLDSILSTRGGEDVVNYLVFHLADAVSPSMGGDFAKESFAFWESYMSGKKEQSPAWKRCTESVSSNMGNALAEAYVQTFDGTEIKKKTEAMISNIKQTFIDDLQELTHGPEGWMDQATVDGAVEKTKLISQKVGAPDKFRDYSSVKTNSQSYLENILRLNIFETRRDLAKIGKPVDKSEWGMMPWEINAYYDRSNNEFVFPFGILQPPSLDFKWSDGANYGSFGGGTIGHELTHGFDNNGSKYDAHGNLKDWWTEATSKQFTERAQCYAKQASAYRIEQVGLNVDGELTLEENLADQGGVKLGYVALNKILTTRPEQTPWQGRYTERQQYWIGYAQSWCTQTTTEHLREQMTTNPHPPAEFRVNGVMMNRPEFAKDFNCKAGDRMAPVNRCSLW